MSANEQQAGLAKLIANAVCESLSIRDATLIANITKVVESQQSQNTNHQTRKSGPVYAKTPQLSTPKIDDPKAMNIETRIRNFIKYREDMLLYFSAAYKHGDQLHSELVSGVDKIYKTWLTAKSEYKAKKVSEIAKTITKPDLASLEEFIAKSTPSILDGIPKNVRSDINIAEAEKPFHRLLYIHFTVMRSFTITNRDHLSRFKEYVAKVLDVSVPK